MRRVRPTNQRQWPDVTSLIRHAPADVRDVCVARNPLQQTLLTTYASSFRPFHVTPVPSRGSILNSCAKGDGEVVFFSYAESHGAPQGNGGGGD